MPVDHYRRSQLVVAPSTSVPDPLHPESIVARRFAVMILTTRSVAQFK